MRRALTQRFSVSDAWMQCCSGSLPLNSVVREFDYILRAGFSCISNCDAVQPGAEAPSGIIGVQVAVGGDQRVLQRVFGIGEARRTGDEKTQQPNTIRTNEVREGFRGPRFCGFNEL